MEVEAVRSMVDIGEPRSYFDAVLRSLLQKKFAVSNDMVQRRPKLMA